MMKLVSFFLFTILFFQQLSGAEVRNELLIFDNKTEAVNYSFKSYWNYLPVETNQESYESADAIVNRLWPYFCQQYPDCENFPKPEILLSFSANSGSFAMDYDGKLRQSNAIILSYELLDTPKDMEFVLAHEMIHYFERHAESTDIRDDISAIKRQSYNHCLDFPWPLEEVKEDLLNLIDVINELGEKPHLISEQAGLPIDGDMGEVLMEMIQRVSNEPNCKDLTKDLNFLKLRVHNGNYLYNNDQKIQNFLKLSNDCFEKYDGNLLKDAVYHLNFQNRGANPSRWKEFDELVYKDGNELERIIEIRNSRYDDYTRLSRKLSGPQLRYQTKEDIADIRALNILLESGRRNLTEYIDYLLVGLSPSDQIRCVNDIKIGKEPNYGALNRGHHSECWRIWRAKKVEERLLSNIARDKQSGSTWP